MNILPLIMALVLMLSVLTIERLEKFKNHTAIQKEWQNFLENDERVVFNERQKKLYEESDTSLRQLTFRVFLDKKMRDNFPNESSQIRMLTIELMKIVYGEAAFFKNLEKSRPNFLEEMLNEVQRAADSAPEKTIKKIQDIAHLKLEDPELQAAFYHMLKGTISRDKLKKLKEEELKESKPMSPSMKEKAYVSLFTFINYDGNGKIVPIVIQRTPTEILKAIFVDDGTVEAIKKRRNEFVKTKNSGDEKAFENEFKDKLRHGIDDGLLNFKLSKSNRSNYD